jgi:hypothetical protein
VNPSRNNFQQANQLPPGFQHPIQPNQQFRRPRCDETQAINLTNGSASTARQQAAAEKQANASYPLFNRRLLSLLTLARPLRSG